MGARENNGYKDDRSMDLEKETKTMKEGEFDYEGGRNSISSHGDTQNSEDNKAPRASRVPKKINVKQLTDGSTRTSQGGTDRRESNKLQLKTPINGQKKPQKPNKGSSQPKNQADTKSDNMKISRPSLDRLSEQSEAIDEKTIEEVKEIDVLDEASNCDLSVGTDDETLDTEENNHGDDRIGTCQKLEEMELKIEKLEGELREVAALEVSLYSVVPEHGCSAHKVHTPARRLSRLYIHACKYWPQNRRATVAKNSISGLVSVAKSCGTDVPRLTFWLSNMVVLRDIISHIFGTHNSSSVARAAESNGVRKEGSPSPVRWKNNHSDKQTNSSGFLRLPGDWEETNTYSAALEKLESWIFSRIVELVWWQALTPHMHSSVEELYPKKGVEKALDSISDQQDFSVNLWKSAFQDAFFRLCPVRAGGHECGCLPVLARLVMEQCISRLDVAMFNAILRESANEMPTDPTSDPIVDSKVLPIPAGNLSFGSGAQLKNSIGNWSRWLSDKFGMDSADSEKEDQLADEKDGQDCPRVVGKSFLVLNELSDLLMLPKDMLINKAIRKEVCPSIGLPLITRVLCNFTPDEFCPDPVPGVVLDELNCESIAERRSSDRSLITSFPCPASPVVYLPPPGSEVAKKVAEAGGKGELDRWASFVQRKGYSSDDDLDDFYSPLASIMDRTPLSSPSFAHETPNESSNGNLRYKLLREVWSG